MRIKKKRGFFRRDNDLGEQNWCRSHWSCRWGVDFYSIETDPSKISRGTIENFLHIGGIRSISGKFVYAEASAVDANHFLERFKMACTKGE